MSCVISNNGETFMYDDYETREEAIKAGMHEFPGEKFFIGVPRPPRQPETYFNADDWLDNVSCDNEYYGEYAEGWDQKATDAQLTELTIKVSGIMAEWLDRHDLRPKFFIVDEVEAINSDGTAFQGRS